MGALNTPEGELGMVAPAFQLEGTDGQSYGPQDVRGAGGLLVAFICNHCPFVKASVGRLVDDARILMKTHNVGVIAIMPNDVVTYPDDDLPRMKEFSAAHRFPFPYVIDRDQSVAKAYGAVCTPDYFGFDKDLKLRYRGRLDEGTPHGIRADAPRELFHAMVKIEREGIGPERQNPSIGCSIKWKK